MNNNPLPSDIVRKENKIMNNTDSIINKKRKLEEKEDSNPIQLNIELLFKDIKSIPLLTKDDNVEEELPFAER